MASRIARTLPLAAFVLHRYDWSESSLILDLFTREQGRIAVAAKGAKRPFSQLRGVLLPFQRIGVTLGRHAGGRGGRRGPEPAQRRLERRPGDAHRRGALQRLLPQRAADEAARPARSASGAVRRLRRDARRRSATPARRAAQAALRAFELVLLKEIGLLPDLSIETATGRPVRPDERYARAAPTPASSPRRARPTPAPAARPWSTLQAALDARRPRRRCSGVARGALAELQALAAGAASLSSRHRSLRTRQVMLEAQALTPAST